MTPLHNCEVQDDFNWQCTFYWDATGDHETDLVHGLCWDREFMRDGMVDWVSSGDCPAESAFSRALSRQNKRNQVYVSAWDFWLGETFKWCEKHKGIWNEKE